MAGITKKVKEKVKGAKNKVIDTKDKAKHIASDTKDKVIARSIKENVSSDSSSSNQDREYEEGAAPMTKEVGRKDDLLKEYRWEEKESIENNSSEGVFSARHTSIYDDSNSINRSVEKASRDDDNFISNAVNSLKEIQFPAYKKDIVEYAKKKTGANSDITSLFKSLNGYMEFKDSYHVQKALEETNPKKKKANQISDQTRQAPNVRTRNTSIKKSIKEVEAVNEDEERRDYPEVTPTAARHFICSHCGKDFQNQNDLVEHKRFEGRAATRQQQ